MRHNLSWGLPDFQVLDTRRVHASVSVPSVIVPISAAMWRPAGSARPPQASVHIQLHAFFFLDLSSGWLMWLPQSREEKETLITPSSCGQCTDGQDFNRAPLLCIQKHTRVGGRHGGRQDLRKGWEVGLKDQDQLARRKYRRSVRLCNASHELSQALGFDLPAAVLAVHHHILCRCCTPSERYR